MLIDEEIESAESELKEYKKNNSADITRGLKTGAILLSAGTLAVAFSPVSPVAWAVIGGTIGFGAASTLMGGISAVWGKLKEWDLNKKITDLKRIQQGQKASQNFQRGRTQENSRSSRLYEEQKAKEAQLRDLRKKSDKSINNSTANALGALAATCLVSPFFTPGVIVAGLTVATMFGASSAFKTIKAVIKERKVKKQIAKIKTARMAEGMRSRGNIKSRMENLSHNGSRPVSRSYLRGEMPKLPVYPRSTSNTRNVVSRPQRED